MMLRAKLCEVNALNISGFQTKMLQYLNAMALLLKKDKNYWSVGTSCACAFANFIYI
jgi:hypothetical protein